MSSLALPREALAPRASRARAGDLLARHGAEMILAVPVALLAIIALVQLPREVNVDTWLELVTGRLVWQTGIPQHETLTALSHGIVWIDQQWLSQLAAYGLYRLGGLGLLGLVNGLMLTSGVAFAVAGARRLGAPLRSTLLILPVCLTLVMPSREVRTQALIVPLFMLVIWLLARDSRAPSRRVFWCLPILVLWANLHGTVTMGAMLVALHGAIILFARRRALRHSARAWARPLALIAGPAAAVLVTPYGLAMVGYYRETMAASTLRSTVTEWQPMFTAPVTAIAVTVMAGLAIWSFARRPQATTTWEKLAVVLIGISAVTVVRNSLFFALLAMMIVPVSLAWGPRSAARQGEGRRRLINGALGALTALILLLAVGATLVRPAAGIEYSFQRPQVLAAVQAAVRTHPGIRVMADEHFDDWLLWRDPALAGRVASDVRFELLTQPRINGLESFFQRSGPNWRRAARGYRLLVLDRASDPGAWAASPREPGARTLYRDGQRMVILRSALQAARG